MSELQQAITFIAPDRNQFGFEGLTSLPPIGSGVYDGNVFWRVTDVWFNGEPATGPAPYGWNVNVEPSVSDDHPPREFDPRFYAD